jgi:hypothetical protein
MKKKTIHMLYVWWNAQRRCICTNNECRPSWHVLFIYVSKCGTNCYMVQVMSYSFQVMKIVIDYDNVPNVRL